MEQVLQNINRLNRNLESIITVRPDVRGSRCRLCHFGISADCTVQVGNEFGSVEALWSQFENFMGRPEEDIEEAAQGKRQVSGESEGQGKSGTPREGEGDSVTGQ